MSRFTTAHSETQEKALWAAVVALEEQETASDFPDDVAERLQQQTVKKIEQAREIRRILAQLEPFQTESPG